jgi:glycosyltransferase involved in cell wall biosynthesis
MSARRVLLIAQRFPPDIGGLARSGQRIAQALGKASAAVDVFAWTRRLPAGTLETNEASGVTLHRLGLFHNTDLSMQHSLTVLEWLHGERAFDLVWGHYVDSAGFLAVLFARRAGIRVTVSARGNDVDQQMFPPGDFARLRFTLERADVVSAVSQDLARKIDLVLGRDAGVFVLPNAVDLETFSPGPPDESLRDALGIAKDEVVLGFSGELRHKKGFPFLVQALREVRRTRPACLLVIGEMRAQEHAQLERLSLEAPEDAARILISGHLETPAQVAAHLRLCDVYLQPSLWEGLPNALLEAMACERCVIASDAGGMPEVVDHGKNGFLVPRARLSRLGEAVLDVLSLSANERGELGRNARARVRAAFHPEAEAAALDALLARACPSSPS